jgi:PTH1 family peptidyl-tRNA hydrolase
MKLIVGLGNPGREYADTRHNVGFLVVDELERRGIDRTRARTLKPDTFMNLSGAAVADALRQTNMTAADVVVAYDDADLPFGEIRVRADGSSGGHNGMRSVIDALGTESIRRVRVGIGRGDNPHVPLDAWVLGRWTKEEEAKLPELITRAADEVERQLA